MVTGDLSDMDGVLPPALQEALEDNKLFAQRLTQFRCLLPGISGPLGFQASIHLPGDAAPGFVAGALLACCRGAAATHSPHLAAVLGDVLDSYGRAGAQKSPAALTVAALDTLARQHGGTPLNVQVPGLPAAVPFDIVRAILVAAGAWE